MKKTNKVIKGILIDPLIEEVKEIELTKDKDGSVLNDLKYLMDCSFIEYGGGLEDNVLYIDENGLFKDDKCGFQITGFQNGHPYIGKAIFVGRTKNGNSKTHNLKIAELVNKIIWFK